MIASASTEMISVDVSTGLVAIVTLVTVLVIGLATLARPCPATIAWGTAFGFGMLGTYVWVAAQQMDAPALQAAASGLMVSFEPIIWLGLRMHLGKRPVWWPVIAFVAIAPAALAATALTPAFQTTFRVVFLAAGVFAVMIAAELFRGASPQRDITLPLALAASAFAVVAVVGAVSTLFDTGTTVAGQLEVLREVNGVGTLVTSVCAAFTLVLLVRADGPIEETPTDGALRARRRLDKARTQGDSAWSILDVRLDDPTDLREASTVVGFSAIVDRFHDDIFEALPASADADRVADECSIVIIHGSAEAVQHHVQAVLRRISTISEDAARTSRTMRVSASIGLATVGVVGYDYDDLVAAAGEAAMRARAKGGDRWERVTRAATTLER